MIQTAKLRTQDDCHSIRVVVDMDKQNPYMLLETYLVSGFPWWRRAIIAWQYLCGYDVSVSQTYKAFYLEKDDVEKLQQMIVYFETKSKG